MKDSVRFGITGILWFLAILSVLYAFIVEAPLNYTAGGAGATLSLLVYGLLLGGAGCLPLFMGEGSNTKSYLGSRNSSENERYDGPGYSRIDSGSWGEGNTIYQDCKAYSDYIFNQQEQQRHSE
jgi:hypothetical protein